MTGKHSLVSAFAAMIVLHVIAEPSAANDNAVIQWNNAALQAVRDTRMGPPFAARALAIVHTCMYDAWAMYDDRAIATRLSPAYRRHHQERTDVKKAEAVSYAAYRADRDLFPLDDSSVFRPPMSQLGFDADFVSTKPRYAGRNRKCRLRCRPVLETPDRANELGDLSASAVPCSDYTGYAAVNPPSTVAVNGGPPQTESALSLRGSSSHRERLYEFGKHRGEKSKWCFTVHSNDHPCLPCAIPGGIARLAAGPCP
jgi:hypothetical protein